MSVIEASSAGVKDMADGSLRITFEFEPRHAAEAFALFGPRGRSVAIAALKDGHAVVAEPEPEAKQPIGPLCMLAVRWCDDPKFWEWANTITHNGIHWSVLWKDQAAEFIKELCEVESRKDLDTDPDAGERFHRLIRGPYSKYMLAKGRAQ